MTTYGIDLACGPGADGMFDLDVNAPPVSGTAALAQALAHRLVTPRGSLLDSAEYGFDVRAYINDSLDTADLRDIENGAIEELRADERVDDASVTATFDGERLALVALVRPVVGRAFTFVLALSDATAELLTTGTSDR